MIWKETKNKQMPTIILLHGGGLSDWSLQGVIEQLQPEFHVVTPIIDGHAEDGEREFVSIEDSAQKVILHIEENYEGKVFAIGGLSIGAQIVTEVLSQRMDIAQYAILESALVYPIKGIAVITKPMYTIFYRLVKYRWFSKLQAKELCVPENMLEQYYQDSLKISKKSLTNIILSNSNYKLKKSISDTKPKVLIIVGEKEIKIMKKSARLLKEQMKESELYIAPNRKHGEISLAHPVEYGKLVKKFFESK